MKRRCGPRRAPRSGFVLGARAQPAVMAGRHHGRGCGSCTSTGVVEPRCTVPALYPPTPNPFNHATTIHFDVPDGASKVELSVYNVRGELVRQLSAGAGRGRRSVTWDGSNEIGGRAAAGVYFVRLEVDGRSTIGTVVMIK